MIIALCSLLSALGLYIQALKHGLGAKRWGLLGLCFGPLMVPMFVSHKRMALMRAVGRHSVYWQCR